MIGINKNNREKIEKNQKIKEGPCIFPFKYKRQEHNQCVTTPKGDICATEINEKTKTLTKYGYCKPAKSSLKKSTKKKALRTFKIKNPKKLKKIKLKNKTSEKMPRYNEEFIAIMGELKDIFNGQRDFHRTRAYQNAEETIMQIEKDITSPDDVKGVPNIGSTILSKLR